MQQDKTNQVPTFDTKAIVVGMGLLFICLQIGFHPTYLQYFPTFKAFNWLHHTHGAIMVSWILVLVNDIMKKNNPIPSTIVTAVILFNTLIFHARYTEVWQAIVRFVGDTMF